MEHTKKSEHKIPQKVKEENFAMAISMGVNWVDLDNNLVYHLQEWKENKMEGKIRMTKRFDGSDAGWATIEELEKKIRDPEPDPRY